MPPLSFLTETTDPGASPAPPTSAMGRPSISCRATVRLRLQCPPRIDFDLMSARGIAILGSTGSIGCNTFRVLEALGPEKFRIVALAAGRNVAKLVEQIARHEPDLVSVENDDVSGQLKAALLERHSKVPRIATGEQGLVQVATHPEADCLVSATVGAVGFVPTLRALQAGKRVALANKETLVMAGELMTRAAEK